MDNSNKNRWMSVVALVVIGCLAFPVSGQSRTETRITHGEWMVTPVADASGMLGMFFSRPVDASNGSYSAFYLVRTGSDWETYGYSGASIGAGALRAEAQFNLGGKLQENSYLAKEIAASGYTSTSLPSTQYSILTNDFVTAMHFAGVFKDAASFPARFVGTDGSASLGLFAKASIRPNCQEIDTPTLTPTIDVIAVFMNELVADYRSEKTYETRARTDLDYCTIGQGCLSCPPPPPCPL